MHFEPHGALGWAIGNIAKADRRLRNYCILGAIFPDIDAVAMLFGSNAYVHYHHTFGHNVFTWASFSAIVTLHCRSWKALLLSFVTFGAHLLADAKLSAWELYLFWPLSMKGYMLPKSFDLGAPINTHLIYYSYVLVVVFAFVYRRTPVDIFSSKLDRLLVSAFKEKTLECSVCGKGANQVCVNCGKPVCPVHTRVKRQLCVLCRDCGK